MLLVERLAYGNRWRARHPADKLVPGAGLLMLSLALPPWPGAAVVLAAAVAAALLGARIPLTEYARLLAVPTGFLLAGAAVLAVSIDASGKGVPLRFDPGGLATAAEASLRALAATSALLLIALTTPLPDLLALFRRAGGPAPLIDLMLLTWRFITLALETADNARTAQAARLGYVGWRRTIRSAGLLAAHLLPRTLDRAARLQTGLAARGWQGDLRVLAKDRAPSPAFIAGALSAQAAIAAVSTMLAAAAPRPW